MNSIGDKIKEYIKKNHMSESDFLRNRRIQSRVSEPCHGRPDISASGEAGAPIQNKV